MARKLTPKQMVERLEGTVLSLEPYVKTGKFLSAEQCRWGVRHFGTVAAFIRRAIKAGVK